MKYEKKQVGYQECRVEYSKEAVKHIQALDKTTKNRIKMAIEKIPIGDIKKLMGRENDYRLRVGGYRVLFSKQRDIIIIKDVLPRGQAYKR
ncbi:MAG: type II toxin-antitoxin system RelE/ParE family toxin [Lachnospiraceae bacterium]|nr:type II toxin-antitoxin system RelE/ParE family toxin [Lachnospiraceae bacterium]MDE7238379.1 type II toxin-antitoxin system RelE/ParE family toxin [Lachnospiraceae bacterium]